MICTLINTDYRYDVQSICQLFFPRESFNEENGKSLTVSLLEDKVTAEFILNGQAFYWEEVLNLNQYDHIRTAVKRAAYKVLNKATGISSQWGVITGIRPALFYNKVKEQFGERVKEIYSSIYEVSDEKINLCESVLENRKSSLIYNAQNSASLYISIPFCPSRCKYCSFVSEATTKEKAMIPEYIDILCKELEEKAELIKAAGENIVTIYVGGGTPTVLDIQQMEKLLFTIDNLFLKNYNIREYTFEAGRPDTITKEKLDLIDKYGVKRISINPQTLDDNVLKVIGRHHSVSDFYNAYEMAKKYNFDINVDIIAGLPTDFYEGFCNTLDNIIALSPENITIHTLYLKRASDFGFAENVSSVKQASEDSGIEKMLLYAQKKLDSQGYGPYYLYRQKNTIKNMENVGYSKKGKACMYNIFMMDDIQQIYGAGAGAVTKYIEENGLRRVYNTKFAYNYIKDNKSEQTHW